MKIKFTDDFANVDLEKLAANAPKPIKEYLKAEAKAINKIVKPGDNVLEVGCGNARLYKAAGLDKKGIEYWGIDNSISQINRAQNDGSLILIHADYLSYPFEEKFDKIIANWNLFAKLWRECKGPVMISKVCNNLKKGGKFVITGYLPSARPYLKRLYATEKLKVKFLEDKENYSTVKVTGKGCNWIYALFEKDHLKPILGLFGFDLTIKDLTPISYIAIGKKKSNSN